MLKEKAPLSLDKLNSNDFPLIKKLSWEQEDMVNKLYKNQRVIVDSIAGSGKSSVSTQAMMALMKKGHIDKIYYVVFPVQEESVGYLPGGLPDKIKEYATPFISSLTEAGVNPFDLDIESMCDELTECPYKVVPHIFLRGRTLRNAGIIIDEAQNGTVHELKKVLTRIDDNCYVSLIGHSGQTDVRESGFQAFKNHFNRGKETGIYTDIEFANLTHDYRGFFSSFSDQITNYTY